MIIIEIPEGKSARIDNQIIELERTDAKKPQDQLEGRIRRNGSFMDDYHDSRHHQHHDVDIDIDM